MQQNATVHTRVRAIWEPGFLAVLRQTGNVSAACRAADIERSTAYRVRNEHEDFRQAWDDALEEATDALEAEARRRAHDGWDEPVYQKGDRVGTIHRYSDQLLALLLKANRTKFRDKVDLNHTGSMAVSITSDDLAAAKAKALKFERETFGDE
jgi:transposase-like protein